MVSWSEKEHNAVNNDKSEAEDAVAALRSQSADQLRVSDTKHPASIHSKRHPRSRTTSLRAIYSQTSIMSVRAGTAVMGFLKSCNGVGVFLGLTCAFCYSLGSLMVKILNSNYRMHPFMLSALRQIFLLFFTIPQVHFCKSKFYGRNKEEWIPLMIRAVAGGVATTLNFLAISHMPIADVGVIYATTPAFTTILARIFLKEKCHISDVPMLIIAFLGVAFILRPPFIFLHIFPAALVASSQDISSDDRLKGSAYAICGAIIQAGQFLALRKMRKINYATIMFLYAAVSAPVLLILAGALCKIEMPPCYLERFMAIVIALSALGGSVFMTLASKFVPPGIVSLTRSAEVAFGTIWQIVFLGSVINFFSIIGLALVVFSMASLSFRQVITEKYSKEPPPNKFVKILLIIFQ